MESTNDTVTATGEYYNVDESTDEALINILLDNDCLAEVLSYLTPMQILETPLVCKKWKTASFLAWKNIKAFYWQRCLYEEQCLILILSKCGKYLKYMTLVGVNNGFSCWFETNHYDILKIVGHFCPNLTYWSIVYEKCIESYDLIDSLSNMEKLKFIELDGFHSCSTEEQSLEVYESMLDVIPRDIEEIHLGGGRTVPSESIVASFAEFTALHCLSLDFWTLNSSFIEMITETYKPLTHLSLSFCKIENDDLSKLVNRMSHTCKVLKLSFSNNFKFSTKFELLEILEVTDPNDDFITSISNYCENIKSLELWNIYQTTGNALKNLEKLKNLESLRLAIGSIDDDSFLGNISEHCKKIKQINLLPLISGRPVPWSQVSLKKISEMKNLENLSISSSNNIDDVVEIIVKSCKKLESFSIKDHEKNITNNCFNSLIQIANLKKFSSECFPHVTDEIILNLNLDILTEFSCSYCRRLTDNSIMQVIKNCPNLKILEIFGNDMTHEVIIYAAQKTRKRTNHTILSMGVDDTMLMDYRKSHFYLNDRNKSINKSPYLSFMYVEP